VTDLTDPEGKTANANQDGNMTHGRMNSQSPKQNGNTSQNVRTTNRQDTNANQGSSIKTISRHNRQDANANRGSLSKTTSRRNRQDARNTDRSARTSRTDVTDTRNREASAKTGTTSIIVTATSPSQDADTQSQATWIDPPTRKMRQTGMGDKAPKASYRGRTQQGDKPKFRDASEHQPRKGKWESKFDDAKPRKRREDKERKPAQDTPKSGKKAKRNLPPPPPGAGRNWYFN
jgi:hypothetical protein